MEGKINPLPPFPDVLRHVWWCYAQLTATRQPGQVIAPITWLEIRAFNREALAGLSAWDKLLIRRVDDRVRAVSLGIFDPSPEARREAKRANSLSALLKAKAAQSRKKKERANG